MAQGSSNQSCRCLHCILLLLCFGFVTREEHYIVPSQSHPCCAEHCLTLSQFVGGSANHSKYDNTTLIFVPGSYTLESDLSIEDVYTFSMYADASSSKTRITCSPDTRFEFRNINFVSINGLHFVECSGNQVVSTGQIHFMNCTFSNDAEVYGTTLMIVESIAYLDRVAFLSTIDYAAQYHANISMQSQENCTSDPAGIHRILTSDSVIIITHSLFVRNTIDVGAVIYSLESSEITIFNSIFKANRAMCCYVNTNTSSRCTGAILRVYNSFMDVYNSRFEHNQGSIVQVEGGIANLTHCVFSNHFRRYTNFNIGCVVLVYHSNLSISYGTFMNNTVKILGAFYSNTSIKNSRFIGNNQVLEIEGGQASIDHNTFTKNNGQLLNALDMTMISLYHNEFVNNTNELNLIYLASNKQSLAEEDRRTSVAHNTFTKNKIDGSNRSRMISLDVNTINLDHNEFVDNSGFDLIYLIAKEVTVRFNEFTSNKIYSVLVWIPYYTQPEKFSIINNILMDNDAVFDIYINSNCKPGLSLSLGSSHCVKCPEHWYLNLFGLVVVAFIAGIVFVVLMLALNLTVAIGTLNGILFYANIVAANTEAYFLRTSSPNFATVIISWLNLDVGFDMCFFEGMTIHAKAMIRLAFPVYVISLVIVIIVISQYSSKFAKIVGKGNPVAVLATMILISYTKLLQTVIGSISLLYIQPAYGTVNVDPTKIGPYIKNLTYLYTDVTKALLTFLPLVALFTFLFTALVFFWKWLVQYQNRTIFKWVRYQKLQHFMEPYHAPYAIKYRYWTGLLLIVRVILFGVSAINFSRDPRVDYVSIIFVVGCLILFKGIVAKRIYKNLLLDVMETTIYFNLAMFTAFTWYSLDFGGNQVAVAYISVIITFALLLVVIIFHIFRFTSLYKLSFNKRSFQWITLKLSEKKATQDNFSEDEPDEVDGVLIQRAKPPYVSYSVVEMSQNEA